MPDVYALSILGEPEGQGWTQVVDLLFALVLCSAIGLEREIRRKNAGLRTHTIVGLGSALFVLISKFGFYDVIDPDHVVLDPSRVAAQIVSGIGFIGAGIIFVRKDAVRGLTTAAAIWISAAVGAACGAGLPILALVVVVGHFVVVYAYPPLIRLLPVNRTYHEPLRVEYLDGRGLLRTILAQATALGFAVTHVGTDRSSAQGTVELTIDLEGRGDVGALAAHLTDIDGVVGVDIGRRDDEFDD
ncbi:MgtC/SapB family protein [Rhodococcus sp. HNM0569]|uniref:MgtC/SapB family protein n=1 Tax=Rhodococcus sp. HNM0569 TaxID=2716340 RepID=UPI00146E0914|nr:MgtC/SapB family protein [Rhodococcus sp. HNM0569]NLU84522.1 MgtC/SapB family protein [Rhodococcus sp. HNM0569]